MAKKKKFQNGGRATPYNPVLHLTNPAEAERQRIAANEAARKRRMPTKEQDRYWWSGLTEPVDEVLRKALGPAAKPVEGLLDFLTPARSIAEVVNKPTAGNIIDAAADTAVTAAGLKTLTTPTKVAQTVNRTTPGGNDMSKYKVAKKLLGEASEKLTKKTPTPTAPRSNVNTRKVTSGPATPPTGAAKQSMLNKIEKGAEKIKDTANQRKIAENIKANRGGAGKPPAVTNKPPAVVGKPPKLVGESKVPAKRKPTTPAKPTGQRGFDLGSTKPKSKRNILGPLAGGTLAAGTAAYLTQSEKDAKPAAGSQATKNKAPYVEGYNMDMDDFDSPKPSYPKPPKTSKPAKEADDGYRYYGKEGTGLGDFSRKYDIKYATQKQFDKDFNMDDGEKRGGRPGKSKMKTQGLNRSKRSGFSGRGTGAALRGF